MHGCIVSAKKKKTFPPAVTGICSPQHSAETPQVVTCWNMEDQVQLTYVTCGF